MAKKVAKTASKNIPSQRGKAVDIIFNGSPVVKVNLFNRSNGRLQIRGVVAFKEAAASSKAQLFASSPLGDLITWETISSYSN